jgi:hypothetical protein
MPPYPEERLQRSLGRFSLPFTHCGTDLMGSMKINDGENITRKSVILFTCLQTRLIYLDVIENLSVKSYLNGIRRFIALWGTPRTVLSDETGHSVGRSSRSSSALKQ